MSDYAALALRVSASMPGIRGCLMLSRDGLLLGAHPEGEEEASLKSAWIRLAALGDPERSYIEFSDQTWAFVRRGSYGAFAIADAGVRPGVLVDLLEQALMAGEMERVHDRDTLRLPEAPFAPSGKPRTSLHKPERAPAAPPERVAAEPVDPAVEAHDVGEQASEPGAEPHHEAADRQEPRSEDDVENHLDAGTNERDEADEPESPPEPEPETEPDQEDHRELPPAAADGSTEENDAPEEETEVDRILLAKEFAGLLQVPKEDDEASR